MSLIKVNISGSDKIIKYNGKLGGKMSYPLFSSFHTIVNSINFNEYDKVIFVLRHSNRHPIYDDEDVELTDLGKHMAFKAGTVLHNINKKFTYCSTNTIRTKQTAFYLYKGRNNNLDDRISNYIDIKTKDELGINGLSYVRNRDIFNRVNYWTAWYGYIYHNRYPDYFNDIVTQSVNFINSSFYHTDSGTIRFIGMHDENLVPFISYLFEDKTTGEFMINFETDNKWLNYLSGILLLKKDSNTDPIAIPITGQPGGYIFRH